MDRFMKLQRLRAGIRMGFDYYFESKFLRKHSTYAMFQFR